MIDFSAHTIRIDNAFSLSFEKKTAYAHPRAFDALSFRIKGNADYKHDKDAFHANKNDIVFVPKNYDYYISSNTNEEVLVVHFYIDDFAYDKIEIFSPVNPDVFENLFSEIYETCRSKPIGYKYKTVALFYRILEQIEIQKNKLVSKPDKLQDALDYMSENFQSSDLNVNLIAKHVKVSEVYLRKIFKKNLNVSPLKHLSDLRLNRANEFLKTGYYTIEEITTLCGFNDSKYFSTVYKKRFGIAPSRAVKTEIYPVD